MSVVQYLENKEKNSVTDQKPKVEFSIYWLRGYIYELIVNAFEEYRAEGKDSEYFYVFDSDEAIEILGEKAAWKQTISVNINIVFNENRQ